MAKEEKNNKKNNSKKNPLENNLPFEIANIMIICFGILLIISIYFGGGGFLGLALSSFFKGLFGIGAYILPIIMISFCAYLFFSNTTEINISKVCISIVSFLLFIGLFHLISKEKTNNYSSYGEYLLNQYKTGHLVDGGLLGALVGDMFSKFLGTFLSYVVIIVFFIATLFLLAGKSFIESVVGFFKSLGDDFGENIKQKVKDKPKSKPKDNKIYTEERQKPKEDRKEYREPRERQAPKKLDREEREEINIEKHNNYIYDGVDRYKKVPSATFFDMTDKEKQNEERKINFAMDEINNPKRYEKQICNVEDLGENKVPDFFKNKKNQGFDIYQREDINLEEEMQKNRQKQENVYIERQEVYQDFSESENTYNEPKQNPYQKYFEKEKEEVEKDIFKIQSKEEYLNTVYKKKKVENPTNASHYDIELKFARNTTIEDIFKNIEEENLPKNIEEEKILKSLQKIKEIERFYRFDIEEQEEVQEETQEEVQEETQKEVQEEVEEEIQEEIQEETQEETQEEVQEETQEETQEEVQEEVQEETQEDQEEAQEEVQGEVQKNTDDLKKYTREEYQEETKENEDLKEEIEEELIKEPEKEENTEKLDKNEQFVNNIDINKEKKASDDKKYMEPKPKKDKDGFILMEKADTTYKVPNYKENIEEPIILRAEEEKIVTKAEKEDENKEYIFPKLEFLNKNPDSVAEYNDIELRENSEILVRTLKSFNVNAQVINISKGPSVTRYELSIEDGIKVSKILGLSDNLALNLAATSIRIEAPIPGKSAVGIEIPNKKVKSVFLSEVVCAEKFQKFESSLSFGLGKDITGNVIVTDIANMPHMLIAGATGSGKSVCINTLITSILYKSSPEEVRLMMIDPKVVELSVYNGIPHLLTPVVTEPEKASSVLNWAVSEMMERYNLFAKTGTRNLDGYNRIREEEGEKKLPKIVIIIDELADLMMVAAKEVEASICRLAQLARAAGIHLIIATQRPSVDVITGLIKSNVPSRIAFAVSSGTDSRTILDSVGAEKLLGKGDMLFKARDMNKPLRIQGAFISDKEVEKIISFIKENSSPNYDNSIIDKIENVDKGKNESKSDSSDELTEDVIAFLVRKGKASTSMIQRQFRIGYNRAARIIEELEERGIVSSENGSKQRDVLMDKYQYEEYQNRYDNY